MFTVRIMRTSAALCLATLLSACASTTFQPASLSGDIHLPKGVSLASGPQLVRVRLFDVSGTAGPATLLAEQFLNQPRQFPVHYSLEYDKNALVNGHAYQLNTEVYAAGSLLLHNALSLTATSAGLPACQEVSTTPLGE